MEPSGGGWGHYWFCHADPRSVLWFLRQGAGLPFKVTSSGSSPTAAIFESPSSFLSWGETLEVDVTSLGGGCTLLFRGSNGHPVDPTVNPKGVAARVAHAIEARFGPLTPSG
jgi:hypothetical protein